MIYGLIGCIISNGPFKYIDGDSYKVDVKGTNVAVSYDVIFFMQYVIMKKNYLK